jgi:hypothetical protein
VPFKSFACTCSTYPLVLVICCFNGKWQISKVRPVKPALKHLPHVRRDFKHVAQW